MIIRPNNISRRGFLRKALGVTAAIFVPRILIPTPPEYGPGLISPELIRVLRNLQIVRFPRIDEVAHLDFSIVAGIRTSFYNSKLGMPYPYTGTV